MGEALSKTLVASEKTSICCAITCLLFCLVATILAVLSIGIGLGYNHCFVDMKTRNKYVPAHYIYEGSHRERLLRTMADEETINQLLDGDDTTITVALPTKTSLEANTINDSGDKMYGWDTGYYRKPNVSSPNIANFNTNGSYISTTNIKEIESDYKKSEVKYMNGTDTEIIPILGLNLIDLIAKLKENSNNYSIQIIKH